MIKRIKTARDIVMRATDRKVDILEEPEYKNLKLIADIDNPWREPD